MKLNAKSNFKNPKPGTVSAVCTRIIDMGTQDSKFGSRREVWIFWELNQNMEDGRPFVVKKSYMASVHPKSNLGKDLKSWLGRELTKEEEAAFDLHTVLARPAILTLVEEGDYVNVNGVSAIMEGMQPLEPKGPLAYFDLDNYDEGVFALLSDKMREKISGTEEYKKATSFDPPSL